MCSSLNMVAQSLIKLPYSYTYSFINRFRPFRIRLQRYIPQQCISETDIRIDHRIIILCSRQLDQRDGYYILLQEREEWIHSNYRLLEPHYDIAKLYTITTHYYLYIYVQYDGIATTLQELLLHIGTVITAIIFSIAYSSSKCAL